MQCPSCGYENSEDAQYCSLCQYSFVKSRQQSDVPSRVSAAVEDRTGPPGPSVEQLSWFQRHLNLTWVLSYFVILLAYLALSSLFLFITGKPPMLFWDGATDYPFYISIMSWIFGVIWLFGVGGWVLLRKSRSLLWLAIFFLGPIGMIIFLFIKNKSDEIITVPQPAPAMPPTSAQPSPF
jgi:hypothetical protein